MTTECVRCGYREDEGCEMIGYHLAQVARRHHPGAMNWDFWLGAKSIEEEEDDEQEKEGEGEVEKVNATGEDGELNILLAMYEGDIVRLDDWETEKCKGLIVGL